MAAEQTKRFEKISAQGGVKTGALHIRYGDGPGDPLPFILILKASCVAHALQKTLPTQDSQNYERQRAEDLKARALHAKAGGFTIEVL